MKSGNLYSRYYFSAFSIIILIIGIIAFLDNFIFDVDQASNSNPVYIIHGLLMYAWYIIFVIQSNYVRKSDIKAHKKLGMIGFGIGLTMLLYIGVLNFIILDDRFTDLPFFGKANWIFYPVVLLLMILSYVFRRRPNLHKHMIAVIILLTMEPLLSRYSGNLGGNPMTMAPITWLALWLSLIIYDIASKRTIHWLTISGFIFLVATYAILI